MKQRNFHKVINNNPPETKIFVNKSLDIIDRINYLLKDKFEGRQKDLAAKLGMTEAAVSKWMSGHQNFTLKTISKLEAAFEEQIVGVIRNEKDEYCHNVDFKPVELNPGHKQSPTLVVSTKGSLEQQEVEFESYNQK